MADDPELAAIGARRLAELQNQVYIMSMLSS